MNRSYLQCYKYDQVVITYYFHSKDQQQSSFMAFINNPFSLWDLFEHVHVSAPEEAISVRDKPLLADLFNFMTNEQGVVLFHYIISDLDITQLQRMVSLLTSDFDYFLEIVTNKFGSKRVQKLLGISDDLDSLFCDVIKRRFLHIMTDKYASQVAIRAMIVLHKKKKAAMYEYILFYALDIARDQHGCLALNDIITNMDEDDDKYYRHNLLEFLTHNALILSKHESGNCVVRHVLQLNYLQYTYNIAYNLSGHSVELSFDKYGSLVVEKLLEVNEKSMVVVCKDLLKCKEDTLIKLARNEFGNSVVCKAVTLARRRCKIGLFADLVDKLMPCLTLLLTSDVSNILDSFIHDFSAFLS